MKKKTHTDICDTYSHHYRENIGYKKEVHKFQSKSDDH